MTFACRLAPLPDFLGNPQGLAVQNKNPATILHQDSLDEGQHFRAGTLFFLGAVFQAIILFINVEDASNPVSQKAKLQVIFLEKNIRLLKKTSSLFPQMKEKLKINHRENFSTNLRGEVALLLL